MFLRSISLAALLAATSLVWIAPADAQGIRFREPAEFPPASFTGSQFVDSRGCVFMRSGISGSATWVPRVTSSRQNLCGMQPTRIAGATGQAQLPPGAVVITGVTGAAAAQGQAQASAQAPAQASARAQAQARPAAQAVAQAPAQVARPAPAQVIARQQPRPAAVNARMAPSAPAIMGNPGAPMQTIASITTPPRIGRGAVTQSATINVPRCGAGMRCGPQALDPVTGQAGPAPRRAASVAAPVAVPGQVYTAREVAQLPPQTRIVPRHVAASQAQTDMVGGVPAGYRPVWEDDRLNPRRAQGTVGGKAAMDLVWTNTVPRRLIERSTGRDMTAANPNVQYPYTDLTTQVRAGTVAAQQASVAPRRTVVQQAPVQQAPVVARISTRAAPPASAQPAPQRVSGRFVQVGAFADSNNASRAVARLQAAGLPVSLQRATSKGKQVQIILAGPFNDSAALSRGLGNARAAGFRDAFARH